jgi:hypothetical protein
LRINQPLLPSIVATETEPSVVATAPFDPPLYKGCNPQADNIKASKMGAMKRFIGRC